MLAVAAFYEIWQMDVKIVFLNIFLKEELYMMQPKGFRQVQGVDYDESFSLVSMLKSVRIMLAIATFYDYGIWQMDVKNCIP